MEPINKKINFYPPKYHILREHKISKKNLCSIEKAKQIAQQMMQSYDSNKDNKLDLPNGEILQFLRDSYKIFEKVYDPTKPSEIPLQKYFQFMDCDGDGVVSLNDLEKHCLKALCPVTYVIQEAKALIETHYKKLQTITIKEDQLPTLIKSLFKQLQMPSYAPKTSGVNEILMEIKRDAKEERKKIKGEIENEEFKMTFTEKQILTIFTNLLEQAGFQIS